MPRIQQPVVVRFRPPRPPARVEMPWRFSASAICCRLKPVLRNAKKCSARSGEHDGGRPRRAAVGGMTTAVTVAST
jgi:hypothetical protein